MLDVSKLSILLVENEPDNLEVMLELLEFSGFTVKTAENGAEGLDILRTFTPDLILLDLSMPVMDGWEMHSHLKANPQTQHIPVVALTAHAMIGDKEQVYEAGFEGYLSKPIMVDAIIPKIVSLLEQHKATLTGTSESAPQDTPTPTTQADQPDSLSLEG